MYSSFRLGGMSIGVRGGPSLVSMLQTAVRKTNTALAFHLKNTEMIFKRAKLVSCEDSASACSTLTVHYFCVLTVCDGWLSS